MVDSVKKFGLIDSKWQHWGASILLTIMLPLLPLGLEQLISGQVSTVSLLIAATIYCCTLSLASSSVLVITMGVISSVVLSVLYGLSTVAGAEVPSFTRIIAWTCMIFFAMSHAVDRYDMHVTRGRNFLDFRRTGE